MRILFFSTDYAIEGKRGEERPSWNGAAWYRCALPARELSRHGHDARVTGILLQNDGTQRLAGFMEDDSMWDEAELVVAHGWTVAGGADQIERARRRGQVIIGDIDDLMWDLPYDTHRATSWDPHVIAMRNVNFLRRNLCACNAITVSTPYLARWMREHWPDAPAIYVVRNAVDLDAFKPEELAEKVRAIGWNGNPAWRADDFGVVRPWLGRFLEEHDLGFVHVGHVDALQHLAEVAGIDPDRVERRGLQKFVDFHNGHPLEGIDVQLIPLADVPYNWAKSALKGLESAAWHVPFVASPVAEYREIFGGSEDLEVELGRLCSSPGYRAVMAKNQMFAAQAFDIADTWWRWLEVFEEVLAGGGHRPGAGSLVM